ncbi:DUF1491 family protein [Sphingomonas profundi]|uniref:DUF1491 family protein n=1 Tax=Alterirhizorhabdus profundi TaxID=2681549 RepID=UPI0012E9796C|nr:DUF1491 family protein [Sphingomonas profundi]
MTPRPASGLLVSALVRAIEAAGGGAMVLAKGDATSGGILLALADRGRATALVERTLGMDDIYRWSAAGPADLADPLAFSDYLARRRQSDPDLWAVELDHPQARDIADRLIGA